MAQRAERETALHYFDLQSEDSGLSATKLGKKAGGGVHVVRVWIT